MNIILDDKTLQYFHVPIAYLIQQIIYKTMGISILVSIFKHDSNTHWRKEGWGHLTSKKRLDIFIDPNLIVNTILVDFIIFIMFDPCI